MATKKQKSAACKNCGYVFDTAQPTDYCPCCGQENNEQLVSFGRFLVDFVNQYLAIDSKLFKTLGGLVFKPGFLSSEYSKGRVVSYILPLRFYLLMSLVYFTIFTTKVTALIDRTGEAINLELPTIDTPDGSVINLKDSIMRETEIDTNILDLSPWSQKIRIDRLAALARKYPVAQAMDSLQTEYPILKDNVLFHKVAEQGIKLYKSKGKDWLNYFLGAIPIMMLLLMPLLALFYKLLYVRRRRYFIEHLTFFLHYHAFVYLMLAIYMLFWGFNGEWLGYLVIIITVYLLLAMKKMYDQGWVKTAIKQLLFMIFGYPVFASVYLLFTLVVSFLLF